MKTNLPERFKKALAYIVVTLGIYIALPFAAMGLGRADIYNLVPIFDCTAVCAVGYFFGRKHGRDPVMPVASAVVFLPVMTFFYNFTAWVYLPILALSSFFGECLGNLYRGRFGK